MKALLSTLVIAILFLASCKTADLKEPEYRDIQNARLIEAGLLQSTAGIDLVYYNPNNYSVTLTQARGEVYIDNKYIGRLELAEKVTVKKNAEFILPALIKLDNVSVIKNQNDIYNRKEILLRIEGMATLTKSGFSKELPFKYEKTESVDKLRSIVSRQ
jgi:LEA14-like dessication related protein